MRGMARTARGTKGPLRSLGLGRRPLEQGGRGGRRRGRPLLRTPLRRSSVARPTGGGPSPLGQRSVHGGGRDAGQPPRKLAVAAVAVPRVAPAPPAPVGLDAAL